MANKYSIYVHYKKGTNIPFYVGRASSKHRPYNFKQRNNYWHRVAAKYGVDVRVLITELSREKADKLEQRLIRLYSRSFKLTNITEGGGVTLGFKHSYKAKTAMSSQRKGVPHSEEWRKKISEAHKRRYANGAIPAWYLTSPEGKERQQQSRLAKKNKPNSRSRKVICHETGEIFNSCSHAANVHGVDARNLSKHLQRSKYRHSISGRTYSWL